MESHLLLPHDVDLFDDNETPQAEFRKMYKRIAALGNLTSALWSRLVEEEEAFNRRIDEAEQKELPFDEKPATSLAHEGARLSTLYEAWCRHFVTHMERMREVQHYGGGNKSTHGSHVFYELTRLNYLIHYPRLLEEMDNLSLYSEEELSRNFYLMLHSLAMTQDSSFVAIVDSFDLSALYEEKEEPDAEVEAMRLRIREMWDRPVMRYTQSDVQILVFFLTQQINDVKTSGVEEYRKVFLVLWLRVAQLLSEFHPPAVLNVEEMRQGTENSFAPNHLFVEFCSLYMGELLRRFFYYDLLRGKRFSPAPPLTARVREWVGRVTHSLTDDAFEDAYAEMMQWGYTFVGDDSWFRVSRPGAVHSRGACIAELRPHLHKRFYSEAQVTRHSVLTSTATSYVSRLFVLRAVDEHLRMGIPRLRFMNAAVVANDEIEMSAYKLQSNSLPLLLQVFSSFWPYHEGRVYVCDDIYEALAVWLWLLREYHACQLYDCDLTALVGQILGEEIPRHIEGGEGDSFEL